MQEISDLQKKINKYLEGSNTMSGVEILCNFIVTDETHLQNIISKEKEQDSNIQQICGYQPGLRSAFYQCQDCQFSTNALICQSCFRKENHLGHRVIIDYLKGQEGSCDCGDSQLLKEEMFCDKHKIQNNQLNHIEQNNNPMYQQISKLIQVLFCQLFNKLEKIADHPIGISLLLKQLPQIKNQPNFSYIENTETQLKQIDRLYQLLVNFLQYLINQNSNNIPFVVDCLTRPIQADIQKFYGLHHSHYKQELEMKLEQRPEVCECSILKNWIRFNVIIDTYCNGNPIDSNLIVRLFLRLFTIQSLKQQFCTAYDQLMLCNFREVTKRTFKLNNGTKILIQTNFINYNIHSSDVLETIISKFKLILHYTRTKVHRSSFENLLFALDQNIFKTFVQNKNYIVQYPILKNMIERMSQTSQQVCQFYSQFRQLMFYRLDHYSIETIKNDLLESIEKSKGDYTQFKQLMQNSYIVKLYGNLIPSQSLSNSTKSVKIYTQLFQQLELLKLNFQILKQKMFAEIKQQHLRKYLVISLMQVIFDRMHNRKMKKYLNCDNYLSDSYIMTDKIFIILLSYYYQVEQSPDLKERLSEIFGYSSTIVQQELEQLVQRNIFNIIIFNNSDSSNYYKRKFRCYIKYQNGEQCQESMDFAMLQLYANIYKDGLIQIFNYLQQFDENQSPQILNLIIQRILAQDYDLLQTCGNLFEEVPTDLKKGFRQMIQNLFMTQNYYQFHYIEDSLEQNGHDEYIQIDKMICQFCRLDNQTGQLCLKEPFKAKFEPMLFQDQNQFEDIMSKLTETNQYETMTFGNALKYDLENQDQSESNNMSKLRLTIIENNFIHSQNLISLVLLKVEKIGINALIKHNFIVYIHLLLSSILQITNNVLNSIINESLSTDKTIQVFKLILNPIISKPEQNPIINNSKKNNLKTKYTKKQLQFENEQKKGLDELVDTNDQLCNHCNIPSENQKLYRLIKLSLSNIRKYIIIDDFIKDTNWFERYKQNEIQISSCAHQFHQKCITSTQKLKTLQYFCKICQITGNCIIPVKSSPQDLEFIIKQLFDFVCESSILEHYFKKYIDNNKEVQTQLMEYEIVCQIYISLIFCQRYEFDRFQNSNLQQILVNILQHLLEIKSQYLDKNHLDYQFYKEPGFVSNLLQQTFNGNNPLLLQIEQNQQDHQLNQQLLQYFRSKLHETYQLFYQQYYLNQCELCNKIPNCFDEQFNLYDQYLCLICLKKYCLSECNSKSANLHHHANTYHNGNTIYIGILQTDIYIQNQGLHQKYQRQLFKNQIGRCPDFRQQQYISDNYLDIQTLQELVEIIIVQNKRNIFIDKQQYEEIII